MGSMTNSVLIVNTHTGPNPTFVDPLEEFIHTAGIEPTLRSGYENIDLQTLQPRSIVLTGVPLDVDYSLSQPRTQSLIVRNFHWLRAWSGPVLGICYGHQILAHIFGGEVGTLDEPICDRHFLLQIEPHHQTGIFQGVAELDVFAEHRDYVTRIPPVFTVLSRKDGVPYIMRHSSYAVYGMQFVPEQSGEAAQTVLARFLEHMPTQIAPADQNRS